MDTFENSLPTGTVLDNRYKIESVLGEGGFGITYKAHDSQLDYTVVIKEFLPQECAARSGDSVTVQARTNRTDDYQYGLERFLDEARNLAKFQHNNIVRVSNFINTNGTVYFVMDYAEGEDLSEWLKQHEVLNEDIILKIVTPILEGLAEVHKTGLLHRDIKPGNIFMRKQGGPMLIDFGAARQALGEHSKSISAIISQGYAPPEQYTTRGKQGAFTDLYAIGATMYKLLTGKAPLESADRAHDIHEGEPDPMIPAVEAGKGKVGDWLLQLTDQMLRISAKDRPQNAEAVLSAIKSKSAADVGCAARTETPAEPDNKTRVVRSGERFTNKHDKKQVQDKPENVNKIGYRKVAMIFFMFVSLSSAGAYVYLNKYSEAKHKYSEYQILMKVDLNAALEKKEESLISDIRTYLRNNKIRYLVVRANKSTIKIEFKDTENMNRAGSFLKEEFNNLDFSEVGLEIYARLTKAAIRHEGYEAVKQNVITLRKRASELGVVDPFIKEYGADEIEIRVPEGQNIDRAKKIFGDVANLEIRLVHGVLNDWELASKTGRVPLSAKLYRDRNGGPVLLKRRVILTTDQVSAATVINNTNPDASTLSVNFDNNGAIKIGDITRENIGGYLAVVLSEEIISLISIDKVLSHNLQITELNTKEAHDLALLLRTGSLHAPVKIISYGLSERNQ